MRVGLVVPGYSADNADWCIPALKDLAERLAKEADLHVLALRYPSPARRYRVAGVRVTALGGGTRAKTASAALWYQAVRSLEREHRRRPFDVLHAFWAGETGFVTTVAGRLLGIPSVVSLAGGELVGFADIAYGGQLARTERAKTNIALSLADAVTVGSASLERRAAPWIRHRPRVRFDRIPLGVDVGRFRPPVDFDEREPGSIVHVASLVAIKEQTTLLRAFALLMREGVSSTLHLIGDGPERTTLQALAYQLDIEAAVKFHGAVRHEALAPYYQRASIFALSSRHEAQCIAALEAAACGVPVVGTAVGVVPELAPHAAIVTPVGDAAAMSRAFRKLLSHNPRRRVMGQAARDMATAEYSLEKSAERFPRLYASMAGKIDRR